MERRVSFDVLELEIGMANGGGLFEISARRRRLIFGKTGLSGAITRGASKDKVISLRRESAPRGRPDFSYNP